MSDFRDRDVSDMDVLLRSAADALVYPATPPIAAAVESRLRQRRRWTAGPLLGAVADWWPRPLVRFAAAIAVIAAIAAGGALAVPQSRSALADFFHLSHVRVEREPTSGPTPPVVSTDSFARPSTAEAAQQLADFPLRFPTVDGDRRTPGAVYIQGENSNLPTVIFTYEDYDLYQTRLGYFNKGGPDPSLIHDIEFDGQPAYWIDEGGHIASFLDEQGRVVVESRRTVDRATLLWEADGITYRLETGLSQEDAIRVAQSLR